MPRPLHLLSATRIENIMVLWSVLAKKTVQKGHRRSRELHSHAETESTIPMSSSSTLPVAGIGCWYTIYDKNSLYCILCLRVLRLMGCACRMPSLCLETFEIHWYLNTDFYFFFKSEVYIGKILHENFFKI